MAAETKIINPYDSRVIASVPVFSEKEVQAAIERAWQTTAALAQMPPHDRAAVLHRLADFIIEQSDPLARLMVRESGKPLSLAQLEVKQAAQFCGLAASEAVQLQGESLDGSAPFASAVPAPVGVVAAFSAFGEPLLGVIRWLAPAVAAGCPLVLYPSPYTPLTALRLTDLLEQAGWPRGAFEIVLGAEAARALAADPRVAHLAVAGRAETAHKIIAQAGLRSTSLHLHHNAAAIVEADAPIPQAAARCAAGVFAFSGQLPTSIRRIYVQRSVYNPFRDAFLDAVSALGTGNPTQTETVLGPLISDAAADQMIALVNGALEEGAWLLAGGEREGRLVAPIVLENLDEAMQIMRLPGAGPVAYLLPFDELDEVLAVMNRPDVEVGWFTSDLARAWNMAACFGAPQVVINDVPSAHISLAEVRRIIHSLTVTRAIRFNPAL